MGLNGLAKIWIMKRFPTTIGFNPPKLNPGELKMLSVDEMQHLKGNGNLPSHVNTEAKLIRYHMNKIDALFDDGYSVVVICFDRASPDVKKLVCHVTRYEMRCSLCKKRSDAVPRGVVAGPEHFDPDCTKGCIKNQILWSEQGPHMHVDPDTFIEADWMAKFSSDSRNLQAEFYPRLANALLQWSPRKPGQVLYIHGLPWKTREVREYNGLEFQHGVYNGKARVVLDFWSPDCDLPLRDWKDEGTVVQIEYGGARCIVPDMANQIHEADNAVFFYSRFFPHIKTQVAYINDGDAISIGLLRALEDFRGPGNFAQTQWLCLPNRSTALGPNAPRFQYVNLTQLATEIEEAPEFTRAGVQSPVATLIFLIVLTETDFFKGEFCFGIGRLTDWAEDEEKRAKQTKGVWDTFFDKLSMYSHLVQYYVHVKSYTDERRIVIDEDLFRIFTEYCYMNKYTKSTIEETRVHCAKLKDPRKRPPSEQVILRWCRQITWNLNYWANAWRNIYIDPFETYLGKPYFGYDKEEGIINVVAHKQKPLDEVYKRNFWKRKQKETSEERVPIPEKRKQAALDLIRGK